MTAKFILLLTLVLIGSAQVWSQGCLGRPCPKIYKPVSAIDERNNCRDFSNDCVMQNEITCRKISPPVACFDGPCRSRGRKIPCSYRY